MRKYVALDDGKPSGHGDYSETKKIMKINRNNSRYEIYAYMYISSIKYF